jgi:two-component system response regulator HydG
VATDPTEQAHHNHAEAILDCISDGVITIDLQKRVTFINRAMREMLGFEGPVPSTLLACDVLVQSNICRTHECVLERALQGERVANYEAQVRRQDGRLIPASINTDFLCDDEGRLIGLIEVIRDISIPKELNARAAEVNELRQRLGEQTKFENMVGRSRRMREIFSMLPSVANSKTSVLITGESGTGKELIAYAIHANSPRKDKPFVVVNCSALSEGILESELFGHVKGAFTGAFYDKVGRFELANGGTIFLDEIGDVSLSTQVKLLRVLEKEEFERVGDNKTIKVDVRVVTATNRVLTQAVKNGTFREDLYYRVRVFPIELPPLRERREDIPLLVKHFVEQFNHELRRSVRHVASEALNFLENYSYPGNVRELQNIIEHAFVCCDGDVIRLEHLPNDIQQPAAPEDSTPGTASSLKRLEHETILRTLEQSGWRYKSAAGTLGISRSTLWRKLKRMGLRIHKNVSA